MDILVLLARFGLVCIMAVVAVVIVVVHHVATRKRTPGVSQTDPPGR